MAISIKQGFERPSSIGDSAEGTITYWTFDEEDETTAHTAALAQVLTDFPSGYRGMPLRSTSIKKVAPGVCEVPFHFGLSQQQTRPSVIDPSDPTNPALSTFNTVQTFNLVGGTVHITNSLAVVQTATIAGFAAVDFKGAIGVEDNADKTEARVRGVDVFAPVCDLTFTSQFTNAAVTDAFIDRLIELTGRTNDATFKRRAAGEMLFKGARGSQRGQDHWEIGFEFAHIKNVTGQTVGDITGINKKGFEYLDVLYEQRGTSVSGYIPVVPVQATVHKVYEEDDFADLRIGV